MPRYIPCLKLRIVAPPRGERGLKCGGTTPSGTWLRRSPSWGAWIEIAVRHKGRYVQVGRSPSWGAWIEIIMVHTYIMCHDCRSPSWGAWIEISLLRRYRSTALVAPPRGERGLKCGGYWAYHQSARRSPSWGAWIEIDYRRFLRKDKKSRSPSWGAWIEIITSIMSAQ